MRVTTRGCQQEDRVRKGIKDFNTTVECYAEHIRRKVLC
jgi:hypothetical protein